MLSGKQIAEARKRKGLTQEALAAELGVSRQTIAKWEQEISTPSVTNAHRLIDILGLQEMENKSSTEDEGNARTICKKRLTKRLLIELWAVYVGIAFLCFFSIGIVALFFIPAISVVLILVAIVVQEVRGKNSFCVSASGEYQVKHKQHPKVGKGTLGCCYLGVPSMGNS